MKNGPEVSCHHVTTPRTARYYCALPTDAPKRILLVCHGYAQAAADFIQEILPAAGTDQVIVAPEGLSRFYRKGFEGEVVASWMTREDRLEEIADQQQYLDQLVATLYGQFGVLPLSVLGFSQGVPTVCRWLAHTLIPIQQMILWAGMVPEPEYMEVLGHKLDGYADIVLGDEDPFFTETRERHLEEAVSPWFAQAQWHRFKGGHQISPELLSRICK
ncbi:MAG: hypothetical protein K9I85_00150 [Saprospiraceae bacterium]|nr:hypothetical protein [Saprospiraceae bacterium]